MRIPDTPNCSFDNERSIAPTPMLDADGAWATTRFVAPDDLRHNMREGEAVYRLNQD